MEAMIIRNHPNNVLIRWPCALCGGDTEKQTYHFELPNHRIVCDQCAENPPVGYVTEVIPVPDDIRTCQDGMYNEDNFPNWMRERLGLPPISDDEGTDLYGDEVPF